MRPRSSIRVVAALLFIGGGALAQQGLIVEPWRKAATVAPTPLVLRPMPASGLPPAPSAPAPRVAVASPAPIEAATGKRWTPPVVALLVDPWAKSPAVAASPHPRWVPQSASIIVDPWANEAHRPVAPAASPRAGAAHSPIF